MTFFYDLNKKLADLAKRQDLTESAQPAVDESALQAYLGKKKYGEAGMKALQQAGRDGAGKEKMAKIRAQHDKYDESQDTNPADRDAIITQAQKDTMAKVLKQHGKTDQQIKRKITRTFKNVKEDDMEEGNEFSGELVKARAQGAKEFKVDGKSYPVKEATKPDYIDLDRDGNKKESMKKAAADKKKSKSAGTAFDPEVAKSMFANKDEHPRYDVKDTGYSKRYTRKAEPEAEKDDEATSDAPKKKGRPKGPEKGPERVTKGSTKYKMVGGQRVKKEKTKEDLDADGVMMTRPSNMSSEDIDSVALVNKGEYDQEGDMAKDQLHTLTKAAEELSSILGDDQNLPEWVQSKITKALDYINAVNDYMDQERHDSDEMVPERKLSSSEKEEREDIVKGMKKNKGEFKKRYGKRGEEVMYATATKLAKERGPGNPDRKKKEESVAETDSAPKASKGGYSFGGGIYESMDKKFTQLLKEGMNISVNMSTDANGQPSKNITVSADGDDAESLAALLKMAGLGGKSSDCGCGQTPCGCKSLDENSPDWPTDTETSDNAMQYSGGLNGPKSTGQTTVPVVASQERRLHSESVDLERNLFRLYQNYKSQ